METLNLKQEEPQRDNHYEESSSGCGGSCFGFFRLRNDTASEKRQGLGETTVSWAAEKIGKAREWSEVIAGPKWKNFVRKVGGYLKMKMKKKKKHTANFQYDPQSYALNFDSGFDREDVKKLEEEEEEENGPLLLR